MTLQSSDVTSLYFFYFLHYITLPHVTAVERWLLISMVSGIVPSRLQYQSNRWKLLMTTQLRKKSLKVENRWYISMVTVEGWGWKLRLGVLQYRFQTIAHTIGLGVGGEVAGQLLPLPVSDSHDWCSVTLWPTVKHESGKLEFKLFRHDIMIFQICILLFRSLIIGIR